MRESVAVVGATGFVGRELLKRLQAEDVPVSAVVRGAPELVAGNGFHAVHLPEAGDRRFRTVVNLAYPTSGPPFTYPEQNAAMLRTVDGLLEDGGHLVHVSTQAVFGALLDRPVEPGPVRRRRDDPYVEAKIDAEVHFCDHQPKRGWSVDIVRLGNVWGRGSGSWGVPLVQRLLTGRPVGVHGREGFSNTTDIANTTSYLSHLIHRDDVSPGIRYHHVAEFSSVPWREWVLATAEAMGVSPVYAQAKSLSPPRPLDAVSIRGVYRALAERPVSGSWVRSGLRLLPDDLRTRLKGAGGGPAQAVPMDHTERMYVAIMATAQEFVSVVDDGWAPVVTREESLSRYLSWVRGWDA